MRLRYRLLVVVMMVNWLIRGPALGNAVSPLCPNHLVFCHSDWRGRVEDKYYYRILGLLPLGRLTVGFFLDNLDLVVFYAFFTLNDLLLKDYKHISEKH